MGLVDFLKIHKSPLYVKNRVFHLFFPKNSCQDEKIDIYIGIPCRVPIGDKQQKK